MGRIKGISVILVEKVKSSEDEFGAIEYEDKKITVDNVLVYPSTTDEVANTTNLTGKTARYTLCIPKSDTHTWIDAEVEFFGRKWRTIGMPQEYISDLVPGQWNKKVMVGTYE